MYAWEKNILVDGILHLICKFRSVRLLLKDFAIMKQEISRALDMCDQLIVLVTGCQDLSGGLLRTVQIHI